MPRRGPRSVPSIANQLVNPVLIEGSVVLSADIMHGSKQQRDNLNEALKLGDMFRRISHYGVTRYLGSI